MRLFIIVYIFLSFSCNLNAQYNSVLSSGDWYTFSTNSNGVYKISYNDFSSLGINQENIQIDNIHVFGNGGGMLPYLNSDFRHDDLVENSIQIYDDNNNGVFEDNDYLLFYGQSPNSWTYDSISGNYSFNQHLYSDKVYYFLNISNYNNKKITSKQVTSIHSTEVDEFQDFFCYENESENLISSGRLWFGDRFSSNESKTFSCDFQNLDTEFPLHIKTVVATRSLVPSNLNISINNSLIENLSISNIISTPSTEYAKLVTSENTFYSSSDNLNIELSYLSFDNGAQMWLDYIEINAKRKLKISNSFLEFRNPNISSNITKYKLESSNNVEIWEITNPLNPKKIITEFGSGLITFKDSTNIHRKYIAFTESSYKKPNLIGYITNQNLHNLSSEIEYVIITHENFVAQANRLSNFHQTNSNLNTAVVELQKVYNEFSSGMQDVTALRDFLRMLYKRPNSKLKYVLLFGDGSYDHKNRVLNNTNYIPTYQSLNSTHPTLTYVTDDYFGLLDENEGLFINDLVDIGIGRLPVSNITDASNLVEKIERYYDKESFGAWRNDIVFIADDGDASDGNIHMSQADSLSNIIANNYNEINISKIYLDSYLQESTPGGPRSSATQSAINNKINKGALLVNYTGHGGPLGWTQERVLEVNQINSWENDYFPLFMTATCKFSYFDDPERVSAGEYVLLNPNGGAIALLSTTRLVYSSPNYTLNNKFINVLFEKNQDEYPRLGDVFKQTKVLSGSGTNNRNFTLLGDPALRLAYPEINVVTSLVDDTIKALQEVFIEGYIEDSFGQKVSNFNGVVFVTVFDKEIIRNTLGQQSCEPMPYRDQNSIIYKGSATVANGNFTLSFIVPKDIAYNYDNGKISYYALTNDDSPIDANGSFSDFIIGGTAENIIYDYDPAEISLYMNTRSFTDGGITNRNPLLLADIFDQSGINTVGNGIGHDIIAYIDGDRSNPYVLNEYYKSNIDNYKQGVIEFPFEDLEIGEHTLTLKVWDIFNNSSEASINFTVTDSEFYIENFTSYPNPFSNQTNFYFQHNKSNHNLNVSLNIYSIDGVLIEQISNTFNDPGYQIGPIVWRARDKYGEKLSSGIYIAQLNISSSDGEFTTKSNRVILLPK